MGDDSRTTSTAAPSSQLVVWPRRRRRPREDTGYVLGWKQHEREIASPDNIRRNTTIVCAGILPPTESLQTYRQRLAKLQDHISECKPKLCGCLTQSLDIVAIWTATPSTSIHKDDDDSSAGLEIITQQRRGYPWWKNDRETAGVHHRQLVFYDPPSTDISNAYAHLNSEFGQQQQSPGNNEWSLLLHQLNHGHDILKCMQTGTFPQQVSDPSTQSTVDGLDYTPNNNAPDETPDEERSLWNQLTTFSVRNSMTLLHFKQLYQQQEHVGVLSWLWCLSLVRFLFCLPTNTDKQKRTTHECRHCGRTSPFVSRSKGAQHFVAGWDRYLETTLDFSLGVGAALLLFTAWRYSNAQHHVWSYYADARRWSLKYLIEAVSRLEEFPAGFKLNVSLTQKMGHAIRSLIHLQQQWLESTFWNPEYGQAFLLPFLFTVSGACGWNSLLAVVMDLWRLENLHLWILTNAFRYMYRTELFLLSALFRLFRGKKRNVLRQRTDSMQYDAMQLLVGTIGFCICIFLWTTMMIYYTFFVITNWVFNLPVVFLWVSYVACRAIPWGSLGWRLWRPNWFSKTVYLESMSADGQDVRVSKLCSIAESPVKLFVSSLTFHIIPLATWLLNALLEAILPRISNKAPCSMPLSHFMEKFCQKGF
jgi:hypothetical protein